MAQMSLCNVLLVIVDPMVAAVLCCAALHYAVPCQRHACCLVSARACLDVLLCHGPALVRLWACCSVKRLQH